MVASTKKQHLLDAHANELLRCRRCSLMHPPPVSGGPIFSKVMLVGQAPGVREPVLKKPFAWTAGRTLFQWFEEAVGTTEDEIRSRVYLAAVCRCFPGKTSAGGDRVPNFQEITNCSSWLDAEIKILTPHLIIPVGKLAIAQFIPITKLDAIIGRSFKVRRAGHRFDVIPLPHPSGASPWHRILPGRDLLARALALIAKHPAFDAIRGHEH